ncbi:hypothetical protein B0H14DRAFT_3714455 [Mycena olivaceomarginata]|nr:hypothetical protein B0H14DRAFT_3714455 [Mycena olivaceomarginata]
MHDNHRGRGREGASLLPITLVVWSTAAKQTPRYLGGKSHFRGCFWQFCDFFPDVVDSQAVSGLLVHHSRNGIATDQVEGECTTRPWASQIRLDKEAKAFAVDSGYQLLPVAVRLPRQKMFQADAAPPTPTRTREFATSILRSPLSRRPPPLHELVSGKYPQRNPHLGGFREAWQARRSHSSSHGCRFWRDVAKATIWTRFSHIPRSSSWLGTSWSTMESFTRNLQISLCADQDVPHGVMDDIVVRLVPIPPKPMTLRTMSYRNRRGCSATRWTLPVPRSRNSPQSYRASRLSRTHTMRARIAYCVLRIDANTGWEPLDIDEELGDGQRMMDLDADDFEGAIPIDGISIDDTPGEQMILGSAFGPSIDKANLIILLALTNLHLVFSDYTKPLRSSRSSDSQRSPILLSLPKLAQTAAARNSTRPSWTSFVAHARVSVFWNCLTLEI